ncbi:MAG: hypothetical protein R6X15_05020 [Pseudomonadota bacterium]
MPKPTRRRPHLVRHYGHHPCGPAHHPFPPYGYGPPGWGGGFGGGWGWARPTPEDEKDYLDDCIKMLKEELAAAEEYRKEREKSE